MDINELATTSENVWFEQQPCCDLNAMEGERRSAKMLSISPLMYNCILMITDVVVSGSIWINVTQKICCNLVLNRPPVSSLPASSHLPLTMDLFAVLRQEKKIRNCKQLHKWPGSVTHITLCSYLKCVLKRSKCEFGISCVYLPVILP